MCKLPTEFTAIIFVSASSEYNVWYVGSGGRKCVRELLLVNKCTSQKSTNTYVVTSTKEAAQSHGLNTSA